MVLIQNGNRCRRPRPLTIAPCCYLVERTWMQTSFSLLHQLALFPRDQRPARREQSRGRCATEQDTVCRTDCCYTSETGKADCTQLERPSSGRSRWAERFCPQPQRCWDEATGTHEYHGRESRTCKKAVIRATQEQADGGLGFQRAFMLSITGQRLAMLKHKDLLKVQTRTFRCSGCFLEQC